MNKSTTSVNDLRSRPGETPPQARPQFIERAPGPVHIPPETPPERAERIYNVDGHLFWGGLDLTSLAETSSKWIQPNTGDDSPVYRLGRVGIGTKTPSSELDVRGIISARGLKLDVVNGVAKIENGEMVGNAILDNLADVNTHAAKPGYILAMTNDGWRALSAEDAISISHSSAGGLDADDHRQYLNGERHSLIDHVIPSLSVGDGVVSATRDGLKTSSISIQGDMTLGGRSGMMIARGKGKVGTDATTDDLPEGVDALYHTNDRVSSVGDTRYLKLDGSNSSTLRLSGSTILGMDADLLDGKHVSDLALTEHTHGHSSITDLGENDHHDRIHQMIGTEHSLPASALPGSVLAIDASGRPSFIDMDVSSIHGNIPASRIGNGELSDAELSALNGVSGNIQTQLNYKSDSEHKHTHSMLIGLNDDDHEQYLTNDRAEEWMKTRSSDDLVAGSKNRFMDMDEIIEMAGSRYLMRDGSNSPSGTVPGLDADSVDGVHGADIARADHIHSHSTLNEVGPDDHHPEIHDLTSHPIGDVDDGMILMSSFGSPTFKRISSEDLPSDIVRSDDLSDIRNSISIHERIIDTKSHIGHNHIHSSLSGNDVDDHKQYLTTDRAMELISKLNTDNLREGISNRYFGAPAVRDAISPIGPLGFDSEGRLSIDVDDAQFAVIDGKLRLLERDRSTLAVRGLSVANGKLSIGHTEPDVVIGSDTDQTNLVVNGSIKATSLTTNSEDGVLYSEHGLLKSGASLRQLSDVLANETKMGDVLSYDGVKWVSVDVSSLIPESEQGMDENTVRDIHRGISHDIPSIIVGQGFFSANPSKGSVTINTPIGKNALDINGGVAIGRSFAGVVDVAPGNLAISGRIGIDTADPREAIDIGSGKIVGGTNSVRNPNTLDLSSGKESPMASIAFHDGGSLEVSADDLNASLRLNTRSAGSFMISQSPSEGAIFSTPEDGMFTFNIAGERAAVITDRGIGIGVWNPRMRLDVRGHIGVSDGSSNPKCWMMMRATAPEAPPTICFPANSRLEIGTLKSYDSGAVWDSTASFEADGTMLVSGRVIGGTSKVTLSDGISDDIDAGVTSVMKIKGGIGSIIGGIKNGFDGATLVIINAGSENISLIGDAAGSFPANRIMTDETISLPSARCLTLVYDGDVSRWIPSI